MGQYSTSVWKVCKKVGQKSTISTNIWVKILQLLGFRKEGGQESMILKKILARRRSKLYLSLRKKGKKILKVWKWGQNSTWPKNWGQNCTMLEKGGGGGVSIFYTRPLKVGVKILHRFKKGGQKGGAYPFITPSIVTGAVFDIAQILAYLVHDMSRSQLYLVLGHFGWLPFSVNKILWGLWLNCISSVEITLFLLADILLQHRTLFQC